MTGKRPTIASMNGIVACAHPLAASAGARILGAGGNAFDAAVAVAATLNVVEPFMSGLAGMGYATCWIAAEKRVRVLDYVTPIPEKFPIERFARREDVQLGALAVGTPGNLAGWCELSARLGTKPLAEVLAPAIAAAREGFPIAEFGVFETNEVAGVLKANRPDLLGGWAANYLPGGAPIAVGDIMRQADLARTFEAIAADGPAHLYGGPLGRKMVEHLASLGGCLTLADLERARPVWKDPITVSYRGNQVNTLPPPCEGFQFLLALRILDGLPLSSLERNGVEHLDTVWRAIRLAAGVRIAHNNPTPEKLAELMGDAHVATLRARVRDGRPITGPTEQWLAPESLPAAEHHTTSFSIADRFGNLICITQSLGNPYGAAVVVPGTGVCCNNFLYWTDPNPRSPNHSKPGGTLPICMAPSISTRDGKPVLALGTPGSYGILQTQVQAMVQRVDFGLPLQDAIEQPRARLWDGRKVTAESRFDPAVLQALRGRGHDIDDGGAWTMKVGGMHGVAIAGTGAMTGGCDPRRDGYVVPV